jgi:hypothetical protein
MGVAVAGAQRLLELAVAQHSPHSAGGLRPLFDVMIAGAAKRATQPPTTVSAQAWVEVETIEMASIHPLQR